MRKVKMDETIKKPEGSEISSLPAVVMTKELRVKFKEPGGAIFANNMVVQRDDTVVYVAFYQVTPPLVFGDDEAQKKSAIEAIESVDAIPVVRVAFPLNRLEALMGALQTVRETMGVK